MKLLHRPDMWCWSRFDEVRDVDFNSFVWVRPEGNIVFDPLPMCAHDQRHLGELGGVDWVVVTNSDHIRAAGELYEREGVQLAGPCGERENFPLACDRWLNQDETLAPGLTCLELWGSKPPGELCFLLEETTLITGDLIRAHRAGSLMLLKDSKLQDPHLARESVRRLLDYTRIDTVLVGDGWPLFGDGYAHLKKLIEQTDPNP